MKVSAAVLAAVMPIAPAFAGGWSEATQLRNNWAPQMDAGQIAAVAVPAPAPAAKASPRDENNYSGAEELLIKEFGVTRVSLDVPESEVMRQDMYYNNAFCFEHALRLSLFELLGSYSDPSSPLARALGEMGALSKPSKSELQKARGKVMGMLNAPSSLISIVRPYKLNQPANGETVEKNWVFFLRLEGKRYWAVVDRTGQKPAYVYGAE